MTHRSEQPFRGESEYDDVREDGVWGEEVALVRWILVDCCNCRLDVCTYFLCFDYEIHHNILAISPGDFDDRIFPNRCMCRIRRSGAYCRLHRLQGRL